MYLAGVRPRVTNCRRLTIQRQWAGRGHRSVSLVDTDGTVLRDGANNKPRRGAGGCRGVSGRRASICFDDMDGNVVGDGANN